MVFVKNKKDVSSVFLACKIFIMLGDRQNVLL